MRHVTHGSRHVIAAIGQRLLEAGADPNAKDGNNVLLGMLVKESGLILNIILIQITQIDFKVQLKYPYLLIP